MARAPKQTNAITNWEEELASQADVAAAQQRSAGGGGKFFSMKAGQLTFDGNPMPGNQMAVVILGDIMENAYYDSEYDPDNPASPKCFAFAKTEDDLEPDEAVDKDPYFERQHTQCHGCPQNEWGSARTGRGKACKNSVRLAIIMAGVYKMKGGRNAGMELELFEDEEHFAQTEVAYMKLPVMSVRNYVAFVKQLAADIRRPPHGIVANVFLSPDPKSQFKVNFELIDTIKGPLLPIVMKRHHEEQAKLAFPYTPPAVDEAPKPAAANNKLRRQTAPPPSKARR